MPSTPPTSSAALRPLAGSDVVPVYRPDLSGNEKTYVLDCLETGWISSIGAYVEQFENAIAQQTGAEHAVAVANGTVALHVALHALGIGHGDEVLVPSFTFIASVNAIAQTGATPVFVESQRADWLIDLDHARAMITPRTRAIMPVHLYGMACDMEAVCSLADAHGLAIVEDCAEALGTLIGKRHVGTFGAVGTFSFFGNKTVTTGEGGMCITDDAQLAALLRKLRGQGQSFERRYWHEVLGFNYRMTNIAAAIGVAQMERLDQSLRRKRELADRYRKLLAGMPVELQQERPGATSSDWLFSLLLPAGVDRDDAISHIAAAGIETRPVFFPAHVLPMYRQNRPDLAIAEDIARRGLSLPSYPGLTDAEQGRVIAALRAVLRGPAAV
jgi:perosamine synthetase